MENNAVRVMLLQTWPRDAQLEFVLIFPDGYEKHYSLSEYDIRALRGLSERLIIEEMAKQYFEDIGEPVDIVNLIFL